MGKITIEQLSKIADLGEQKIIVIQKVNHGILKSNGLLNRKLKVILTLETLDD